MDCCYRRPCMQTAAQMRIPLIELPRLPPKIAPELEAISASTNGHLETTRLGPLRTTRMAHVADQGMPNPTSTERRSGGKRLSIILCSFWLVWCRHDLQDAAFLCFPVSTVRWLKVNGFDGAEGTASASHRVTYIAELRFLRLEALREEDRVRVWEELPGKQCFPSQQDSKMPAIDMNKVKDRLVQLHPQGLWRAFVVNNQTAYFKNHSADDCYNNLIDDQHSTTYLLKEEGPADKSNAQAGLWDYFISVVSPRSAVIAHTVSHTSGSHWRLSGMLINVGAIEWEKDSLCLSYRGLNQIEQTDSIVTRKRLPGETQDFQMKLILHEQGISKFKGTVLNFTVCECTSISDDPNISSSTGRVCNSGADRREVHRWNGGLLEFQKTARPADTPRGDSSKVPLCVVLEKIQESICIAVWMMLAFAVARATWAVARNVLKLVSRLVPWWVIICVFFSLLAEQTGSLSLSSATFRWELWLLPTIICVLTIVAAIAACRLVGIIPEFTLLLEEIVDHVLVSPDGADVDFQSVCSNCEYRFWAWVVLFVLVLHAMEDCILHSRKFLLCQCFNSESCEDSGGFAKALAFIGMVSSPCYWLCLYHLWESGLLSPVPVVQRDQIEAERCSLSSPLHRSKRFSVNSITTDMAAFCMPVWNVGIVGMAITMWLSSSFHIDGQIDPLLGVGVYGSPLGRHSHVMFFGDLVYNLIGRLVQNPGEELEEVNWKLPEHFQVAIAPATRAIMLLCLGLSGKYCVTRVSMPSQRFGHPHENQTIMGRFRDLHALIMIPFHIYIAITWWGGGFAPRMLVTFTYYRHCQLLRKSFNTLYYKVTDDPEHTQGHPKCDYRTAIAEYSAARWAKKWGMLQFGERLRYAWAVFTVHTLLVVMIDSVGSMDQVYEDNASMARAAVAANRIFLQLYVSGKAWYMASMLIKAAGNFFIAPLERATWIVERPWKRDANEGEHVTREDCLAFARYAKHSSGALWHFGVVRIGSGFATALMQVLVVSQASKLGAIFTVYKASDLLHGIGYFTR